MKHVTTKRLPPIPAVCLLPVQPLLKRIMKRIILDHPTIFDRLGPYKQCSYVIDAGRLPFLLLLWPDPLNPRLRALTRGPAHPCDARITGSCAQLARMADGCGDGDALFFSRDIHITGNLDAVVCLRNAIDDLDGSIMDSIWGTLRGPGRFLGRPARRLYRRRAATSA